MDDMLTYFENNKDYQDSLEEFMNVCKKMFQRMRRWKLKYGYLKIISFTDTKQNSVQWNEKECNGFCSNPSRW